MTGTPPDAFLVGDRALHGDFSVAKLSGGDRGLAVGH